MAQQIGIGHEYFKGMREAFDLKLQEVIAQMEDKDIDMAEISLKLSIAVHDRLIPKSDGSEETVKVPAMSYKVAKSIKLTDTSGGVCTTQNPVVIQCDRGRFVMQYLEDEQMHIDYDCEDSEVSESAV